jgi:hypothetical protein
MTVQKLADHEPPAYGFTFMWSYYRSLSLFPEEDRLALYDAICRYSFLGEVPDLKDTSMSVFELLRPTLDHSMKLYQRKANKKKVQDSQKNREKDMDKDKKTEKDKEKNKEKIDKKEIEKKKDTGKPTKEWLKETFDELIEIYPNKQNLKASFEIWCSIRPTDETVKAIREHLESLEGDSEWENMAPFIGTYFYSRDWESQ